MKKLPLLLEHDEQAALIIWAELPHTKKRFPNIERIFAIPNGGFRHRTTAMKLKKEGVKAGVWDLFLPVPIGEFHGLFIEMKRKPNKLTEDQTNWGVYLQSVGYVCAVCWSFGGARLAIEKYYGEHVRK